MKLFFKNEDEKLIEKLKEISNGLGIYSNMESPDNPEVKYKGLKMLSEIQRIESLSKAKNNSDLLYCLAIAYKNYTAWYKRGDERKEYLLKVIKFLDKSVEISKNHIKAKEALGQILIEEKVVRNLEKGRLLLEELKRNNQMSDHLNSVLMKANRQTNNVKVDEVFDLCKFNDPSPGVFREERKSFRQLVKTYKKEKNFIELEKALNNYYKLGVLVTMCYPNSDCNSGVSGEDYEKAKKIIEQNCDTISLNFKENGYIKNNLFISENDWKIFDNFFGKSTKWVIVQ